MCVCVCVCVIYCFNYTNDRLPTHTSELCQNYYATVKMTSNNLSSPHSPLSPYSISLFPSIYLGHHPIYLPVYLCSAFLFCFLFVYFVLLYVNCFGRTMLYMCIEYHI